jgi:hypothetical protein
MGANILHRIGGLVCLAVAAGFGWFFIWQPLQQAQAHAPQVEYSIKAFVLVPFAAVFGLFFLLFGDSVPYRNVEKRVARRLSLRGHHFRFLRKNATIAS